MKNLKTENTKQKRISEKQTKTFASTREINKATHLAMTKYAEAIKSLADR